MATLVDYQIVITRDKYKYDEYHCWKTNTNKKIATTNNPLEYEAKLEKKKRRKI